MSIKHCTFEPISYMAFGSITNAFQSVTTLSDDVSEMYLINSTDTYIRIQLPQISSNAIIYVEALRLPPNSSFTYSGRTNRKTICKGDIKIAYDGDAPTLGEFSIGGVR